MKQTDSAAARADDRLLAVIEKLTEWCVQDNLPDELLSAPAEWLRRLKNITKGDAVNAEPITSEELDSLYDQFVTPLKFGTAGLRAIMGPGMNRMNLRTVAHAGMGVAGWLRKSRLDTFEDGARETVVVAFDNRHHSAEFAALTAGVLSDYDFDIVLFDECQPTPQLVHSVRSLSAVAGIMITASHNPAAYNGYKVYNRDGTQIGNSDAADITREIEQSDPRDLLRALLKHDLAAPETLPNVRLAPRDLIDSYHQYVRDLFPIQGNENELTVVYTPVHGTGGPPTTAIMRSIGVKNLIVVPEQFNPDPDFTTAPAPNPENPEVLSAAAALALKHQADLVLATDPDADRATIMLPDKNGLYTQLDGNEIGALLVHIVAHQYREKHSTQDLSPAPAVLVKSVVTDNFGAAVARAAGFEVREELTGFKNICGAIPDLVRQGKVFLMGYEESIGYAFGDQLRDKDGLAAIRILTGEAARLKRLGLTLGDELEKLRKTHGYFSARPFSLSYSGAAGRQVIQRITDTFRRDFPLTAGDGRLIHYSDYSRRTKYVRHSDTDSTSRNFKPSPFKESDLGGSTDNLLVFQFDNGSWYALRPSGTEPKLKFYIYAVAEAPATAKDRCEILFTTVSTLAEFSAMSLTSQTN